MVESPTPEPEKQESHRGKRDAQPPEEPLGGSTFHHVRNAQSDPEHPSWHNLVHKVDAFVRDSMRRSVADPHAMDDLVAEVFRLLYRDLHRFQEREGTPFWAWVSTLTNHALVDLKRRGNAEKRGGKQVIQSLDLGSTTNSQLQVPDDALHPTTLARIHELQAAMLECFAGMRNEVARVLEMRLLQHLNHAEIAEAIGRNKVVTVRSIYDRGLAKLQECLRGKGFSSWIGA